MTGKMPVSPIFKTGEKDDCGNYRLVSVLSCVSNLFENLVHDQLFKYLNGNAILTKCQSGFR